MGQITLSFSNRKNGNHGRRARDLTDDFIQWIADQEAAEDLRRERQYQSAKQRAEGCRRAKASGVTPTMRRATRRLMRR